MNSKLISGMTTRNVVPMKDRRRNQFLSRQTAGKKLRDNQQLITNTEATSVSKVGLSFPLQASVYA